MIVINEKMISLITYLNILMLALFNLSFKEICFNIYLADKESNKYLLFFLI